METLAEIRNLQDGAVVNAVQVRIDSVYDRKIVDTKAGQKPVQSASASDATGNKIRITAWEHEDLKPLEGKDLIVHSNRSANGRYGGVSVKHGSYIPKGKAEAVRTVELVVSKAGKFQLVEVYHQSQGTKPTDAAKQSEQSGAQASISHSAVRNGQQVGQALNLAGEFLREHVVYSDVDELASNMPKDLYRVASAILRVSDYLSSGNLADGKSPKQEVVKQDSPKENLDEDIPF